MLHLRVTSAFDDDGFWLARATVQMFDLRELQVTSFAVAYLIYPQRLSEANDNSIFGGETTRIR